MSRAIRPRLTYWLSGCLALAVMAAPFAVQAFTVAPAPATFYWCEAP